MLLAFCALTIMVPVLAQGNEEKPCVYYGGGYFQSKKIRPISVSTSDECSSACKKENKCLAWEFIEAKEKCTIFVVSVKKNQNSNYGIKNCINHGEPSGNAPTCSLRNKRVELKRYWWFIKSEEKCINKCDNSKKCLAWQYHVHLRICRLTVKIVKKESKGAIHGIGYCKQ